MAPSDDSSDHFGPAKRGWLSWSRLAILAIVTLILLMRPWGIHLHTTEEAVADEPRVAVMYFDNQTDPTDSLRLGDIATDLLITGLSQSRQVRVLSTQRLYDLLKLMGREGQKRIDRSIATEVARNGKAKWMLLGSILETYPHLVITAQAVEVATGEVASAVRITGKYGEDIFAVTDTLTAHVSQDLSLPFPTELEFARRLGRTTNSLDAYRYYVEGVEAAYRYDVGSVSKCLRKTLELDSTFAMAYYWMAFCNWSYFGLADTARIAKAVKYRDNVTHREQLYIDALQAIISTEFERGIQVLRQIIETYPDEKEAYRMLGICATQLHRLPESVEYLMKAIEIDSMFADAYNYVSYAFMNLGDSAKSLWAADKYIALVPNEPHPYATRADLMSMRGNLVGAIPFYQQAAELRPYDYLEVLGDAFLMLKQYSRADSCFRIMAACPDRRAVRAGGRTLLALIPLYQGKFKEARTLLDEGTVADQMEQFKQAGYRYKYLLRSYIFEVLGFPDSALSEVEQVIDAHPKFERYFGRFHSQSNYARLLALNGRFDEADRMAEELRNQIKGNETVIADYWWTLGCIESARKNWEKAITDFEISLQHSDSEFTTRIPMGIAYMRAGQTSEAISVMERALRNLHWWRLPIPTQAVLAYYYLGQAYEQAGRNEDAIRQYEEFLDIWKNADSGIAEVIDARNRLTRLKLNI